MKKSKNLLTLALMSSSMILLVSLQVVWLRSSYEKATEDLRGETTRLLRDAVFAVRDSTLLQSIEALPPDSAKRSNTKQDTSFVFVAGQPVQHHADGQVQIYVSSTTGPDSARRMLSTLASRIGEGRMRTNSRYTIRLRNDSLNEDSIRATFSRNLSRDGLPLTASLLKRGSMPPFPTNGHSPVRVRRMMDGDSPPDDDSGRTLFGSELRTHWVRTDPFFRYAAVLNPVRPLLLREITPQILFSSFLTLLTLASFIVMYRSSRSQQRLMALKNDFISNITHELKTPIATVSVALEALKNFKGIDNPQLTAEYLDIARLELNRLSLLTEKVLTTSLFDEKGIALDIAPVDMEETISAILNSMKLVADKAQATLTFEKSGKDFVVEGSAVHLTNVIHNLLDNALKYSPQKPEVLLSLKESGSMVTIAVTDKGIGIPPEYQSRIFERFFRMPTGDVHNIKGYGLGLSYVEQVIRRLGGTITVASVPGQGSTFTVILPKRKA